MQVRSIDLATLCNTYGIMPRGAEPPADLPSVLYTESLRAESQTTDRRRAYRARYPDVRSILHYDKESKNEPI